MSNSSKFPQIFNRLCHMAALTKEGKTKAAIDNLVITVFAIDHSLAPTTPRQVVDSIENYFGLTLNEASVQSSIDYHLSGGGLLRNRTSKILSLSPNERAKIESQIEEANNLECSVRDEWFSSLNKESAFSDGMKDELWRCLRAYMAKAFQRHGAETTLLLDPSQTTSNDVKDGLSAYLEEAVKENSPTIPADLAQSFIGQFFLHGTPSRVKYLAQLLDGTFTYFALTVDDATSTYLKEGITPLSLFLDTNFIFGVLNLHTSALNAVSAELIETIKTRNLPFKLYYHEETLLEIRRTIGSIGDRVKAQRWTQAMSRAAIQSGVVSGIELKYHELNAESPTDADIYFSKYDHITDLLDELGFTIYRINSTPALDEKRHLLVAEYEHYINQYRPKRPKSYEALNHDMAVWLTVSGSRRKGVSIFDAGAFFITTDYYLYKFDWQRLRERDNLGIVTLSNQFMQLLRPFVSTNNQADQL